MSEEQARHVSGVMKIIVKYHNRTEEAYVNDTNPIGMAMDKVLTWMGTGINSNHVFLCGGEILSKGFSFRFYKTLLFANNNVIQIIDKMPRKQLVKEIVKIYDVGDLINIICDLKEAKEVAHKKLNKEYKAYDDYMKRLADWSAYHTKKDAEEIRDKFIASLEKKQLPKKLKKIE